MGDEHSRRLTMTGGLGHEPQSGIWLRVQSNCLLPVLLRPVQSHADVPKTLSVVQPVNRHYRGSQVCLSKVQETEDAIGAA